jgi:predicted nucleotidyltransferase
MTHNDIIQQLTPVLKGILSIEAAVLYGSVARKEETPNSDIDVALMVNDQFTPEQLVTQLRYPDLLIEYVMEVKMRNKVVAYFNGMRIKTEFSIHHSLDSFSRDFTGSTIPSDIIPDAIILDRSGETLNALNSLNGKGYQPNTIEELVDKFIYEFDNASTFHRRSDGYRALYFYQIALHCLIQLVALAEGNDKFLFLPRHLLSRIRDNNLRDQLYNVAGSMYLPEFNTKKRKLLNLLYETLTRLEYTDLDQVKALLERIYNRDWHWNLRPVNTYNREVKWSKLVRSSSPTRLDAADLREYLNRLDIHTVIDLRAPREVEKSAYPDGATNQLNIVQAPFDPWNQPDWFKEAEFQDGEHQEIAYRFFTIGCRDGIKRLVLELAKVPFDRGALIHCHAGKDRTGIIVSIIHLLTGQTRDELMADYLACESDTVPENLNIALNIIEREGGVVQYLLNCGLTKFEIDLLCNRLGHE